MEKSLDNLKNQLLLISAANGETKNVEKYLKEGAFIDIKDANGYTPLHCACFNKHVEVVKLLVEAGANVNLKDTHSYGFTVLQFASAYGYLDLAKVILKTKQADIHEVKSSQGKTAIDLASTKEMQSLLTNDLIDRTEKKNQQKEKKVEIKQDTQKKILEPKLVEKKVIVNEDKVPLVKNDSLNSSSIPLEELKKIDGIEEQQQQTQTTGGCCTAANRKKCCKKFMKAIPIFLFFFFPLLSFWFSPYGFPFYIYPCGLILGIAALVKIRKKKDELKEKNVYGLLIHAVLFSVINGIFVWSNIWGGGFPWSIFTLSTGGLFLTIHALKTKYKGSKYNTKFHIHALFFAVFALLVFTTYIFGTCHSGRPHHFRGGRRPSWNHHRWGKHNAAANWSHHKWNKGKWKHHHNRHNNNNRHNHRFYRNHHHNMYFCSRSIIGFGFFMIPVFIWAIILTIHYLKIRNVSTLGCCGLKLSFTNQQPQVQQ